MTPVAPHFAFFDRKSTQMSMLVITLVLTTDGDIRERKHGDVVTHKVTKEQLALELGDRRHRTDLRTLTVHQRAFNVSTRGHFNDATPSLYDVPERFHSTINVSSHHGMLVIAAMIGGTNSIRFKIVKVLSGVGTL